MWRFFVALGLVFASTFGAACQTAIQWADCSIQNVVGASGTLKLENVVINCGKGAEPRTALKVNYYWLDAVSASFLLAGRPDSRLTSLLGNKPILLTNEVSQAFEDLQTRFGNTIGSHSLFAEPYKHVTTIVQGASNTNKSDEDDIGRFRNREFSGLRVFDGMEQLYWPDSSANREMLSTPQFPKDYKHYVRKQDSIDRLTDLLKKGRLSENEITEIMSVALISRVFYKSVKAEDLDKYRDGLLEMRAAAQSGLEVPLPYGSDVKRMRPPLPPQFVNYKENPQRERELVRRLPELSASKTLAALRYISRDNLPEDFIRAYGLFDAHSDEPPTWNIFALPRRVFLQIAVIENSATTPTDYDLKGFTAKKSRDVRLRKRSDTATGDDAELRFTQARLSHRERVVVPLAIEFRSHLKYGDEDRPSSVEEDAASFELVKTALAKIPRDTVVGRDSENEPDGRVAPKPKSLFVVNEPPPAATEVYLYGPSYVLTAATLQSLHIPIRPAEPAGVYRVAGYPGGSCPTVYYRVHGDEEWYKLGNVLRTALGADRLSRDEYELPNQVSEVAIAEEEPESSFINSLRIVADGPNGTRNLLQVGHPFRLDVFDVQSFLVPHTIAGEKVRLLLEGYYQPYSVMAAAASKGATKR